jgi:hypothetical protein
MGGGISLFNSKSSTQKTQAIHSNEPNRNIDQPSVSVQSSPTNQIQNLTPTANVILPFLVFLCL